MTQCQKTTCNRDAVGTVEWNAGTRREYCQTHLAEAREQLGDFIAEVKLA
jgi:hypothetical protein